MLASTLALGCLLAPLLLLLLLPLLVLFQIDFVLGRLWVAKGGGGHIGEEDADRAVIIASVSGPGVRFRFRCRVRVPVRVTVRVRAH